MKVFLFFVFLSLTMSCQSHRLRIPAQSALSGLASPVCLESDTTELHLADYFPSPEKIKKISLSDGLQMIHNKENGVLKLFVNDSLKFLFNIRVRYEDYTYDFPVLRFSGGVEKDSLQIVTHEVKGDTIYLQCSHPVSSWAVYFENYKLDNRILVKADCLLGIIVPEEATVLKNGKLRIWVANGAGVSSGMMIPLRAGKLISGIADLDTLEQPVADWFQKVAAYDILKDTACYTLVQLLKTKVMEDTSRCVSDIRTLADTLSRSNCLYADFFCNSLALMFGDYIPLRVEKQVFAYMRSYFGEELIVIVNRGKEPATLKLDLPGKFRNTDFKSLFGNRFSYDNSRLIVDVQANRVEVIYN